MSVEKVISANQQNTGSESPDFEPLPSFPFRRTGFQRRDKRQATLGSTLLAYLYHVKKDLLIE